MCIFKVGKVDKETKKLARRCIKHSKLVNAVNGESDLIAVRSSSRVGL
jgi:hypothetical protein